MDTTELVVDVRGHRLESLADFRDAVAVAVPGALPTWQGRSLDALWDTIENRGISELIDSHDVLVVRADRRGLFSPGHPVGGGLVELLEEATRARLELSD
ncbi:hypothetical protein OHV05_09165 [Kitasatospora sp. NBC_00070]|uniref:hypothetical protein n=1 Tax=Kitasatospora sp. NBC_00070 TaxID=2975962 RepID=UPI00324BC365